MTVVSNTTPILSLYKIKQLHLLHDLFGQIFVPTAIYNEITVLGKGKLGHEVLTATTYIHVREIKNTLAIRLLRSQLDYGEAEAIVLAQEMGADIILLDEKKARKIALANSQRVIGTLGVLQLAKDKGLIANMKMYLDELITSGIWIDKQLYQLVLSKNNEIG
jgi:predicted nucleic acid-binding protein